MFNDEDFDTEAVIITPTITKTSTKKKKKKKKKKKRKKTEEPTGNPILEQCHEPTIQKETTKIENESDPIPIQTENGNGSNGDTGSNDTKDTSPLPLDVIPKDQSPKHEKDAPKIKNKKINNDSDHGESIISSSFNGQMMFPDPSEYISNSATNTIQSSNPQLMQYEHIIRNLQTNIMEHEQTIARLQSNRTVFLREREHLENAIEELRDDKLAQEREDAALIQRIKHDHEHEVAALKAGQAEQFIALQNKLEHMQHQLDTKDRELLQKDRDLDHAKNHLEHHTKTTHEEQGKIDAIQKEVESLKRRNQELHDMLVGEREENKQLVREKNELQSNQDLKCQQQLEKNQDLKADIHHLKQQINDMKEELVTSKRLYYHHALLAMKMSNQVDVPKPNQDGDPFDVSQLVDRAIQADKQRTPPKGRSSFSLYRWVSKELRNIQKHQVRAATALLSPSSTTTPSKRRSSPHKK